MSGVDRAAGDLVAGRYRLDRVLGQGGMGSVWAATHTITGKEVALKFLHGRDGADPIARARFVREARAACAVKHRHVVGVHDVLDLDGEPAIVMDLLEGESLRARLDREKKLSVADAARVLVPVARAIGAAHASGVVHRDLKPDNVFLLPDGDVKVLDFGIAKLTTSEAVEGNELTGTGAMLGTPFYMAPEQAYGEKDVDGRADLWALGIVIFECVSGRRPTEAANLGQILKIITQGKIPALDAVEPSAPPELAAIVKRCLQGDREARVKDVAEVIAVLEPLMAGGATLGGAARGVARPAGRAARWRGGVLALAVVTVAAGLGVASRRRPSPPTSASASTITSALATTSTITTATTTSASAVALPSAAIPSTSAAATTSASRRGAKAVPSASTTAVAAPGGVITTPPF